MEIKDVTLNTTSESSLNSYKTLAVISEMYAGRDDYRIIGGQMVNLILASYPVSEIQPRMTQDADTAIDNPVELLAIADKTLIQHGFSRTGGGVFVREGAGSQQEVNFLTSISSPSFGIRPVSIAGDKNRQLDALPELELILASPHYIRVNATVTVPNPGDGFSFSILVPSAEYAVMLKTQAIIGRNYQDKDLKDLLTLFEIRDSYAEQIQWGYSPESRGRRKDTVEGLQRIHKHLRRYPLLGEESTERLRGLIQLHVLANPAE